MQMNRQSILAVALGMAIGGGAVGMLGNNRSAARGAAAASSTDTHETRSERMKNGQATCGDLARDAQDHLRKGEEEMQTVAERENSDVAKQSYEAAHEAKKQCDRYITELEAKDVEQSKAAQKKEKKHT
jgi:hypothetical protein